MAKAIGTTAGNGRYSRYKNPEYDKILDEMAPLSADDPKFQADAVKAMEIYWRDVIDIPVIQWLHRIPYNQTYWTNWPYLLKKAGCYDAGSHDAPRLSSDARSVIRSASGGIAPVPRIRSWM